MTKAKFAKGHVVRVEKHYFRIAKVQYSADRCASWDNGWWYYEADGSRYSENCVRGLRLKEVSYAISLQIMAGVKVPANLRKGLHPC